MRASPAECNSALPASPLPARRVQGGAHRPFGCKAVIRSDPGSGAFWGDAHAGASSRVQLGAPGPPLPSPFPLGYPPTASRRSRWCFLGDAHAGVSSRVQLGAPSPPLSFPPSARRRSQSSPLPYRRVQGGAHRPFGCKAVIRSDPGSGAFWGDAHAGVSSRVQLGAPSPPLYLPAEFKAALPVLPLTLPPSARRRSRASPLPSRRVQGGAHRPFGCKAVIRSDPGSGAFWGDAHAGVSSRVQLGAPRPPPYLPAECKAALPGLPLTCPPSARRRSRAIRVQGGAHRPFGCKAVIRSDPGSGAFWGDAHAGVSSRVQLGAPGPPLPSPFPLGYPPTASRRSRWCFLGRRPCGRLQPSATRRSQASPLPSRRLQVGAPGGAFWGDAHAGASSRVQLGAPGLPLTFPPSATRRSQPPLGCPPTTSRRSQGYW